MEHRYGVIKHHPSTPFCPVPHQHHFGASGSMAIGNNIERFRVERGWSRPQLAEHMGTSYQQVEKLEKGQRRLSQDWIERAAAAFGVAPTEIIAGEPQPLPEPNALAFHMEGSSMERMREDLPIYGTALGAAREIDGEAIEQTTLNSGDIVQYAKRPVLLNGKASAYGLYVSGSSMEPRHRDGEIILADSKGRLHSGDDVVVYLRPLNEEDDNGTAARAVLVKRLVRRTSSYVELEQYSPAKIFRINMEEVVRIDRVIPWSELLS